jgi:hypothetical protein
MKLKTYKGVDIYSDPKDKKKPFYTVQNVPVIGSLQVGHSTIEDAEKYIDKTAK